MLFIIIILQLYLIPFELSFSTKTSLNKLSAYFIPVHILEIFVNFNIGIQKNDRYIKNRKIIYELYIKGY